jgi:phosphatidylserine/phosphatidylglycerophosphate/cardiolipin synthase-like enzyme
VTDPPRLPGAPRRRPWLPVAFLVVALLFLALGGVWWLRQDSLPSPTSPAAAPPSASDGTSSAATAFPDAVPAAITGVFIEPGDGRAPLLDEIAAAQRAIDLEVYIVSDEIILDALADAARRGIAVRVILEEHPFGGGGGQPEIFAWLENAGIAVRYGNPVFRFTHIKTMVIDNAVAIIMNQNLTESAFTSNRDFGVITNEPDAVRTAAAIFAADWTRGDEPDPRPLVVSPTNARAELLAFVAGASDSLDLYAEVLRDTEILDALIAAVERGVRVRLIVSDSPDFAAERAALAAGGVDVRLASSLYVHAKVIVADDERAFIGSQNLSATSLDLNRELGIIVADPVNLARITRTFEIDFRVATPQELP